MKEILLNFIKWYERNTEDVFDVIDEPEKVIDKYLAELEDE